MLIPRTKQKTVSESLSISTESFLPNISFSFPLRLVAYFSYCGDCKSQVFPSWSCGLDWDQEGSSDYGSPYPQATRGIRKFANIPHPFLVSWNTTSSSWTVSQLVPHAAAAAACPSLGWVLYKGGVGQKLSWQITTFFWLCCSFPPTRQFTGIPIQKKRR